MGGASWPGVGGAGRWRSSASALRSAAASSRSSMTFENPPQAVGLSPLRLGGFLVVGLSQNSGSSGDLFCYRRFDARLHGHVGFDRSTF